MTWLDSILLGIVQGITEFLPVSSDGHLVLGKRLLGIQTPGTFWEVALHLGTLLAIVVVFWKDILRIIAGTAYGLERMRRAGAKTAWQENEDFRLGCYLILGTVPVAVVGMIWLNEIENLFNSAWAAAGLLFVNGIMLSLTRLPSRTNPDGRVNAWDAILIGIAQTAALLPGISRSGMTISTGLHRGVSRSGAATFSFLLAVPAILGAAAVNALRIEALPSRDVGPLVAGMLVSALVGYFALRLLLRIVRRGRLHWFGYYCLIAGVIALAMLWGK